MVHTGPGVPFANPANVMPRLDEYPDVDVVLAHAGFGFFASDSLFLAKKFDNVYLETSWTPIYDLSWMVSEVPDKIIFGTDLLPNTPVELAKIEALKLSDDVKEAILYGNAKRVFNLPL